MKTITPLRTTVASFSSSSHQQQPPQSQDRGGVDHYDSGEYILAIASNYTTTSSSQKFQFVAAALSNQSIIIYNANSGTIIQRIEKAHDGPISDIKFFPHEYRGFGTRSDHIISTSQDGTIKVWEVQCNSNNRPTTTSAAAAIMTMKLGQRNEQALSVSLGYGGTLAAVGTDKARISFFDLRYNNDTSPSGTLMGSYVDAHTEEVTKVHFQTISTIQSSSTTTEVKTVLASASEDGLIALHDPSQPTEDDALQSVLNIGTSIRNVGFFGPTYEGLYALTGNETLSIHHWDSAQKVSDVGGMGLRELLSNAVDSATGKKRGTSSSDDNAMNDDDDGGNTIEYLVGCTWVDMSTSASASPALHLLAGNSNGDSYLFRIDADEITPLIHLKGGHRGCIRDFCLIGGGGKRLVTGGEDARLCEWDLSGNSNSNKNNYTGALSGKNQSRSYNSGKSTSENVSAGRKGKKKKFGSPY